MLLPIEYKKNKAENLSKSSPLMMPLCYLCTVHYNPQIQNKKYQAKLAKKAKKAKANAKTTSIQTDI
jgi:hypothetical protein